MVGRAQTERNKRILKMYQQGMKQAEIAKKVGLSTVSISSILRSMPGYQRRGTDKTDKVSDKALNDDRIAREELQYLDMLNQFTRAVDRVNELGANGVSIRNMQHRLKQLTPAFLTLVES